MLVCNKQFIIQYTRYKHKSHKNNYLWYRTADLPKRESRYGFQFRV